MGDLGERILYDVSIALKMAACDGKSNDFMEERETPACGLTTAASGLRSCCEFYVGELV